MEEECFDRHDVDQQLNSFHFQVKERYSGFRLDHYLVLQLPDLSRSQISSAIKAGNIVVNSAAVKASLKLKTGDQISGNIEDNQSFDIEPQPVAFDILHEDTEIIVISKPPDLVVHPGSGNRDQTLVNGLLYHCNELTGIGDPVRPGIVHRLDRDTSGVMVIAKSSTAHRMLTDEFKNRRVQKRYHAIVAGVPPQKSERIVAPIGRHPVHRKKMAIRHGEGRFAASTYRIIKSFSKGFSFVEVEIETGRTHQIRVHMASIGCPVAGDRVYGGRTYSADFPRQMLHASELYFIHPLTSQYVRFSAPLAGDMEKALNILGSGEVE